MNTPTFKELYDSAREFVCVTYSPEIVESRPELVLMTLQAMATHTLALNVENAAADTGYTLNEKSARYKTGK